MAARKTPATKAPAKKAPAKKAVAKAAPEKKITAVKERYSKTQMLTQIAENTELTKKQVQSVLDELTDIIEGHVKKRACGEFVILRLVQNSYS